MIPHTSGKVCAKFGYSEVWWMSAKTKVCEPIHGLFKRDQGDGTCYARVTWENIQHVKASEKDPVNVHRTYNLKMTTPGSAATWG